MSGTDSTKSRKLVSFNFSDFLRLSKIQDLGHHIQSSEQLGHGGSFQTSGAPTIVFYKNEYGRIVPATHVVVTDEEQINKPKSIGFSNNNKDISASRDYTEVSIPVLQMDPFTIMSKMGPTEEEIFANLAEINNDPDPEKALRKFFGWSDEPPKPPFVKGFIRYDM